MMIIPHPKPIIANPTTVIEGELYIPSSCEGPIKKKAMQIMIYPRQITPDFLKVPVSTYIKGLVEA